MFLKIIPEVSHSRFPKYVKVFLFLSISHPIKLHVHCLVAFLLYFSVSDSITG